MIHLDLIQLVGIVLVVGAVAFSIGGGYGYYHGYTDGRNDEDR